MPENFTVKEKKQLDGILGRFKKKYIELYGRLATKTNLILPVRRKLIHPFLGLIESFVYLVMHSVENVILTCYLYIY